MYKLKTPLLFSGLLLIGGIFQNNTVYANSETLQGQSSCIFVNEVFEVGDKYPVLWIDFDSTLEQQYTSFAVGVPVGKIDQSTDSGFAVGVPVGRISNSSEASSLDGASLGGLSDVQGLSFNENTLVDTYPNFNNPYFAVGVPVGRVTGVDSEGFAVGVPVGKVIEEQSDQRLVSMGFDGHRYRLVSMGFGLICGEIL